MCKWLELKLKIDPVDKILLKRNLNQNGQAQKFFSSEVRRMSDPYVPFQKGSLKNTARVYQTALSTFSRMPEKITMKTKVTAHREQAKAAYAVSSGFRVCGLTKAKLL